MKREQILTIEEATKFDSRTAPIAEHKELVKTFKGQFNKKRDYEKFITP